MSLTYVCLRNASSLTLAGRQAQRAQRPRGGHHRAQFCQPGQQPLSCGVAQLAVAQRQPHFAAACGQSALPAEPAAPPSIACVMSVAVCCADCLFQQGRGAGRHTIYHTSPASVAITRHPCVSNAVQTAFPNGGVALYGKYDGGLGIYGQRYRLRLFYSGGEPLVIGVACVLLGGWTGHLRPALSTAPLLLGR